MSEQPTIKIAEVEMADQGVADYLGGKITKARGVVASRLSAKSPVIRLGVMTPQGELQNLQNVKASFAGGDKSGVVNLLSTDIAGLQKSMQMEKKRLVPMGQFHDDAKFLDFKNRIVEGNKLAAASQISQTAKPWFDAQIILLGNLQAETVRGKILRNMEVAEKQRLQLDGLRTRLLAPAQQQTPRRP